MAQLPAESTPVYAQEIGQLLPVEGNFKFIGIMAGFLILQVGLDSIPDGLVRNIIELIVQKEVFLCQDS